MSLTTGIIGLPNVGKSTLFNALSNARAEAANYPFATIQPNIGVAEVPDERLERICEIFQPRRRVPATIEFIDIAGLVKGASLGEGLGNQFLGQIREVDALCHVVRCFDDPDITHVENGTDPLRDIEIVNLELILADLQTVENRINKIERKAAKTADKEAQLELRLLERLRQSLEAGRPARAEALNKEEEQIARSYQLLSGKPVIYAANLSETALADYLNDPYYAQVAQLAQSENNQCLPVCAKIEDELSRLDKETKALFIKELNLKEDGLGRLIKTAYSLLGLGTFFTTGEDEGRAWTFRRGMKAPDCGGIIHSDFARGFIKVETYSYDDLIRYGSEKAVKEQGKLRIEGRDYPVNDGDILFFKFNV